MVRVMASRPGTVPGQRRSVLDARLAIVAFQAGQMEQHGEARRTLDQRADRRAAKPEDKVAFPVPRHRPVIRFGRALADHDLGRHEALPALADPRSGHAKRPAAAQAGGEIAAQRSPALNEQRLIDGFVAEAHAVVVRKVDGQTPGNLLRTPCR